MRLLATFMGLCIGLAPAAHAADWYTGAKDARPDDSWTVSADVSGAVTTNSSRFVDAIVTAAVTATLRESGVRLRAEGLAGVYDYKNNGLSVHGQQEEGSVMLGYEQVWSHASLAAYAGIDARNNRLSVADPGNPVVGSDFGLKVALDYYANPTPDTMVAAYASYATDREAYFGRLRGGYAILPNAFLGPEVGFLGDQFFNQWRVGAHLTGLYLGPFQLSLAVGYDHDRVQKSGLYTTVDARVAF